MRTYLISTILISCCITSCMKDELPVPKHISGEIITARVNMDASYKWQIYFDLGTNSVTGQNLKTAWDLGFETATDGAHIVLNSSKTMFAFNTGQSDFSQVTDTTGYRNNRKWDAPSGRFDSTAIGNWQEIRPVYIIDRGFDEMGNSLGFRKIQILSVDETKYNIRFAGLNGDDETLLEIPKDQDYNLTFLSFNTSSTVIIEPPKDQWDLVFTQYTHVFYDPFQTYLVTGCLQNRHNTSTAVDSLTTFDAIRYENIAGYTFSTNLNTIGYNWKVFVDNTYNTLSHINYIIRDHEGYDYKLHFIDFYDEYGVKGNPTWEYRQL